MFSCSSMDEKVFALQLTVGDWDEVVAIQGTVDDVEFDKVKVG